jgi:S-DNA-T family DNA segregation ATPase FtsK/SpoIIIE
MDGKPSGDRIRMSAVMIIGNRAWLSARVLWDAPFVVRFRGVLQALLATLLLVALASWNPSDPSLNAASSTPATNWLGANGALFADLVMQSLGLAAWPMTLLVIAFGLAAAIGEAIQQRLKPTPLKALSASAGVLLVSAALSALAAPVAWPLASGLGGLWGDAVSGLTVAGLHALRIPGAAVIVGLLFGGLGVWACGYAVGLRMADFGDALSWGSSLRRPREPAPGPAPAPVRKPRAPRQAPVAVAPLAMPEFDGPAPDGPTYDPPAYDAGPMDDAPPWNEPVAAQYAPVSAPVSAEPRVAAPKAPKKRAIDDDQIGFEFTRPEGAFDLPPLGILSKPPARTSAIDEHALKQNAKMLEGVLAEFGVRGVIDQIRPGPVVTLYELAPAPGVKHGRVVALSDDIARSMSARACRISVVQGRNAIGIELPNVNRETVYLRDLLASSEFDKKTHLLPLALGETIGGEPYVADLARMPHLLIAGTTGSGKSVGVNAMILSILYRHSPGRVPLHHDRPQDAGTVGL